MMEVTSPSVIAQAANIVAASTRGLAAMDARPVLQHLARVLERTLQRLKNAGPRTSRRLSQPTQISRRYLDFAMNALGGLTYCIDSYNLGLLICQKNDALLVTRVVRVRYGVDRLAAEDFKLAIQVDQPSYGRIFYLAHDLLVSNRFDECRRMCKRALDFVASERRLGRALTNGWRSQKRELGFPRALVRSAFEEAIRLGQGRRANTSKSRRI